MAETARNEIIAYDSLEVCPYFGNRTARLPLRFAGDQVGSAEFDACLEQGDRRYGHFLYKASCPDCSACEAIRLDVNAFSPSCTQRRVDRRGRREFTVRIGPPILDAERVRLFNLHMDRRGLSNNSPPIDELAYRAFLVETCCDTFEVGYYLADRLTAVAICDRGKSSISAVYCYYDVGASHLSPGTFSILTLIRLCRGWNMRYLYLGYYIAESPHMCYKANFAPHERRIGGRWRRFDHRRLGRTA